MCSSSAAAREPEPAKASPTAATSNNKSVPTKMTSSSFATRQLASIALLGGMSAFAYSYSDSFSCSRYIANAIVEPILIPLLGGPTQTTITSPQSFFETCLVLLLVPGILIFAHQHLLPFFIATIFCGGTSRRDIDNMSKAEQLVHEQNTNKPSAISTFQLYYLPVFWLLRTSFWMSGPYFFPVYASKLIDGQPISLTTIGHIFHFGFGMAALLLPGVASMVSASYTDERSGTIAAAIFYGLGALSVSVSLPQQYATGTNILTVLFAGRAAGSIGTGLLNVMPEAWLSSEIQKSGADPYGRFLSSTFATAYAFDSIVAIGAGRMASWAADKFDGPTGPFWISPLFLVVAMLIVAMFWTDSDVPVPKKKNSGADDAESKDGEKEREEDDNKDGNGLSLQGAIRVILSDTKIILIGSVQFLFEAAMYIFVLNQAPTIKAAAAKFFAADNDGDDGADMAVPSGIVFGCFMACCLLGSNLFGYLTDKCRCRPERIMTVVLMIAAAALAVASLVVSGTAGDTSLLELCAAFFVFELCVGVYYPSISWLRSKYLPVAHRSIIMTIVAVPFNLLVLSISLSTRIIGVTGAWATASVLLLLATVCLIQLQRIARREAVANLPKTWKRVRAKWVGIARVMQIRKMVQGIAKQAAEEDYE